MHCTKYLAAALVALSTMGGIAHATCVPYGAIAAKYNQLGGANGPLGVCTGNEFDDGAGGRIEFFAGGQIDWDGQSSVAYAVWGPVAVKWQALGAATWGHPTQDLTTTPDRKGTYGWFRNNSGGVTTIYDKPNSFNCIEQPCAAHVVLGAILSEWANLSYERGVLGYPITDEQNYYGYGGWSGERYSEFDNGFIRWRPDGSLLVKLTNDQCPLMTGSYVVDQQQNGIDWCPFWPFP